MNMEIINRIITFFINSMMGIILILFSGKCLFNDKNKINIKKNIFPIIIYILFLTCNDYVSDRLLKTMVSFVAIIFLYKIIYKKDFFKTIIISLEIYLLILFSEIILCIIGFVLYFLDFKNMLMILNNSIIINLTVIIISLLTLIKFKNNLLKLTLVIEKHSDKISIIYFFCLLVMLTLLLTKINLTKTFLNFDFFINLFFCLFLITIIIIIVKQKIRYQGFLDKYKQLANYTESIDSVMEQYRIKNHEYKNQLGIIKSLILPENDELNEYISTLIEKSEITNSSTINQLNQINLPALKGLLNFKINELQNSKININVLVSTDMKKVFFENLDRKEKDDLYSIIGVFLDNAKEAAIESNKKQVFIDITYVKNKIKITIANTYKNQINLEEIKKYGFTTKGKERGIGLYLIEKIIEKNQKYSLTTSIKKDMFIQNLYISNSNK